MVLCFPGWFDRLYNMREFEVVNRQRDEEKPPPLVAMVPGVRVKNSNAPSKGRPQTPVSQSQSKDMSKTQSQKAAAEVKPSGNATSRRAMLSYKSGSNLA